MVQCFLSVSRLAWGNPVLESKGSMVRLLQTSKRTYANKPFPGLLLPSPLSLKQATAIPHICRRPSDTHRHKSYDKHRQHIKRQGHHFPNKDPYSQSYGFSINHIWMWELECKEGWAPKNWCFWTVALENTLKSPLDSKEIKPINPKGNQHLIFIGRTDPEAEAPTLWPSDEKSQLIGKDRDAGKDWGWEEKRAIEDEMVGWHHQLNGHEFEQISGDSDWQGSLLCCSPWDHNENNNNLII